MTIASINHVNLPVDDIDEAVEFYGDVLELERIPSIDSNAPGAWFRVGGSQLHLTERPAETPAYHHVSFNVDDFESYYDRLDAAGALEGETFGSALYVLPDGAMQMYFRDPSGNLLEMDWPDATTLPQRIQRRAITRLDRFDLKQTEEGKRATIYLEEG